MPLASALIGLFLCFITVLFHKIDIRNQFDVKQSQYVLTQFERDHTADTPSGDQINALGVFSNEENIFELYDSKFRKSKAYLAFLDQYNRADDKNTVLTTYAKEFKVSAKELKASLKKSTIPHLSSCIKVLYTSCMMAGILGAVAAIILWMNSFCA